MTLDDATLRAMRERAEAALSLIQQLPPRGDPQGAVDALAHDVLALLDRLGEVERDLVLAHAKADLLDVQVIARGEMLADAARAALAKVVEELRGYADWLTTGPNTERVRQAIAERIASIADRAEGKEPQP